MILNLNESHNFAWILFITKAATAFDQLDALITFCISFAIRTVDSTSIVHHIVWKDKSKNFSVCRKIAEIYHWSRSVIPAHGTQCDKLLCGAKMSAHSIIWKTQTSLAITASRQADEMQANEHRARTWRRHWAFSSLLVIVLRNADNHHERAHINNRCAEFIQLHSAAQSRQSGNNPHSKS